MPPAGRLGDKAQVPADGHGCPGCPHPAIGPAISGSGNVNINGRPALRVTDKGMHAACCGSNTWEAVKGAPGVFINGKAAHRLGDANQHCGGQGKLVEGSSNVNIGDLHGGNNPPNDSEQETEFYFDFWGIPLDRARIRVTLSDGSTQELRLSRGWVSVRHPGKTVKSVELLPRKA